MKNEKKMKTKRELEPKTKHWNQNILFLTFGGSFAIMISAGFEMFKILAKDYSFKFDLILKNICFDYYLIGIVLFFLFGIVICYLCAKKIDLISRDLNLTLKTINKKLNI